MLSGTVRGLVADGLRTAVAARGEAALRALVRSTAHPARTLALATDYTDTRGFRSALERARDELGPFRTVVLWIRTPSRDTALPVVADVLAAGAVVVDVRGSAAAAPGRARPLPPPDLAGCDHRPVVLGFADGPDGTRWLTHQEIADGVLAAARAPAPAATSATDDAPARVIGRVRPWHDRP
ncbi:hypothetical protein ACF08W_23280 [Streptomyces sp. NPDC015144]|uniref:hypothetical protein n=1 Tax=Streptomyces sp. NPDC015144 TaxID=3364944 RepID=UPI0036FDE269